MRSPHPLEPRLQSVMSNAEHILWPPLPLGNTASLTALLYQLDESQWFPPEELQRRQFRELEKLAAYAYSHSPYFRQRMDQAGLKPHDLSSPEGLRKLPFLSRRELRQVGTPLYCSPIPASHLPLSEGKSSGSTGEPVIIQKTVINRMLWHANMMREHFWHKRDFRERLVNIRAALTDFVHHKGWGAPVDLLYRSGDSLGVPVTLDTRELIRIIRDFGAGNLIVYPNTLGSIVAMCEKEGITIPSLHHIWCIGETLKPELRQRAATVLGANIEDDYSCNEIGIMALQCPQSGLLHVMSESVLIEVIDEDGKPCKEGQVGKVIVTDLHNFATPMIRYDIGDLAEVGDACPCGRGLPTLKAIKGRNRNLVIKPDGSKHWPPLSQAILYSGLPILQFQVIQHSLTEVEALIVASPMLTTEQETVLKRHLHEALKHPFELRITYFEDKIPRTENGKFEDFICRI